MFWGAGCRAPTVGLLLLGGSGWGAGRLAPHLGPGITSSSSAGGALSLIRDTGTSLWGGAEGQSWLAALCPRCSAGLQPFPEVCWGRGDTGVGFTPRGYLCKLILWQLACD